MMVSNIGIANVLSDPFGKTATEIMTYLLAHTSDSMDETDVDMSVFESDKHLCSWCGLAPANNKSAGKMKSVRIPKAGDYLKPMMVQCARKSILFFTLFLFS